MIAVLGAGAIAAGYLLFSNKEKIQESLGEGFSFTMPSMEFPSFNITMPQGLQGIMPSFDISSYLKPIIDSISSTVKAAQDATKSAQDAAKSAKDFLDKLPERVKETGEAVVTTVTTTTGGIVKGTTKGVIGGFFDALSEIKEEHPTTSALAVGTGTGAVAGSVIPGAGTLIGGGIGFVTTAVALGGVKAVEAVKNISSTPIKITPTQSASFIISKISSIFKRK